MSKTVSLKQHHELEDLSFDEYELESPQGSRVSVLTYGAMLHSLQIAMKNGEVREVLMGCDIGDLTLQDAYLGATIGRYANRIANGKFMHSGRIYDVTQNLDGNCLHGGKIGFDKRVWQADVTEIDGRDALKLSLISPDGDQGFPGELKASAIFSWRPDNELQIEFRAEVDVECPVCLTSHGYFNLMGSPCDSREHELQINSDFYLPVNATGIPETGLQPVAGTAFDFNQRRRIDAHLAEDEALSTMGYDYSYQLHDNVQDLTRPAATVISPDQKLRMEVYTNQPAIQFYTARWIENRPARGGKTYQAYDALCLEPQVLPDSPNHPEFGDCFLKPSEVYSNIMRFKFSG